MRRHFRELAKDILSYGVLAGISGLTGVLLLPIFTRVFERAEYGALDILVTLSTLAAALSRLGLPSALARFFHAGEPGEEPGDRGPLLTTLTAAVAFAAAAIWLLTWLAARPIASLLLDDAQRGPLVHLAMTSAMIGSVAGVPLMWLRMQRRILAFNALQILQTLSYASTALVLVLVFGWGIEGVLLGSVAGAAGQLLGAVVATRRDWRIQIGVPDLRRSLRYGLPIMPSAVVAWVNRQADRLVLLAFLGLSGVGVFGAAARAGNAVLLFTDFFRKAWQPYAMSLLKEPAAVRNTFYRNVLNLYLVGFSIAAVFLVALAKELFSVLVGAEYQSGYVILPWLIGAGVVHIAGDVVAMGVLISERTAPIAVASWSGAAINVAVAILLIPAFGVAGAAVGYFFAELVYVTILWRSSVRRSQASLGARRLIGLLAAYVVTAAGLLFLSAAIEATATSLTLRLLLAGGFGVVALSACADPATRRSLKAQVLRLPGQARLRVRGA